MKKVFLILAVLMFAVPALAVVTVTAVDEGSGVVRIDYSVSGEPNLVRAFALGIDVNAGVISSISDYNVGECNSTAKGYGIFMGTIQIDDNPASPTYGQVLSYGTPVAGSNEPDNPGQIGSSGIVIEMGSLYDKSVIPSLAPSTSGRLCKITVTSNCWVSLSQSTLRGGIVREDANAPSSVVLNGTWVTADCYTGPDYTDWVDVNKPASWCYPRQCHGDADGLENTYGRGQLAWVATEDINILVKGFRKPYSGDPAVDGPDPDGDPDTWISADFDHTLNSYGRGQTARVATEDIGILVWHFRNTHGVPPDDCLTSTPTSP